jgi:hypothetical protein
MDKLMIFALVIQIVILLCIIGVWVAIAIMPGRIAKSRGHPQAEAINVCGWFGALTMGILAPVAFIWAFSKPVMKPIELEPPAPPVEAEPESSTEAEKEAES